jgi:hypothetical protein
MKILKNIATIAALNIGGVAVMIDTDVTPIGYCLLSYAVAAVCFYIFYRLEKMGWIENLTKKFWLDSEHKIEN